MRSIYAVFLIKLQYALLKQGRKFASEWRFEISASRPRYPQSNGTSERDIEPSWSFIEKHAVMEMTDTLLSFNTEARLSLDCLEESPLYSMIFGNILTIFEPNLNLRKSGILTLFQKFMISQSVSILAIVSHPHYLPGFNHLSSIALQNKTIIGQHSTIEICFSRFAIVAFIFTGLCCGWLWTSPS